MSEREEGLRRLLLELVADMQGFCYEAEELEPCGLARSLLRDARERLRRVEAQLDLLAPEPPPVVLWPRPPTKPLTGFVGEIDRPPSENG